MVGWLVAGCPLVCFFGFLAVLVVFWLVVWLVVRLFLVGCPSVFGLVFWLVFGAFGVGVWLIACWFSIHSTTQPSAQLSRIVSPVSLGASSDRANRDPKV